MALTSPKIIAAVTAPGEVAGAVDFSEMFYEINRGNEQAGDVW